MASVNYTIPVIQGIRLAAFYDIGNVWRDAYDFEPSGMAAGAGVGIRFDVPGFPIRLDRAWALEKDDERTDEDAWVVWIGYDL
jgi:outer membrane translocation and assembly module TamA